MKTIRLGQSDLYISQLGLGCAGFSEFYRKTSTTDALATLDNALALGINFFDTADMYGKGDNENLLSHLTVSARQAMVIASKAGVVRGDSQPNEFDMSKWSLDNRPSYLKRCCDNSLKLLKTDYIDLFYLHAFDGETPIEESMSALSDLVKAGKIRHIGLSNILDPTVIQNANAIHPVSALQNEYSLWQRSSESLFEMCRALNITFVAYSPLGRGALSGVLTDLQTLAETDYRRVAIDYQSKFSSHQNLINALSDIAKQQGISMAQLALAWIVNNPALSLCAIPGSRTVEYLIDNVKALEVALSDEVLARLNSLTQDCATDCVAE